jgi:hypothetical protein
VDAGTGNVQVVADDGYADSGIIYIGIGRLIRRGQANKTKTWSSRGPTIPTSMTITGAVQHEGVVYVVAANSTESKMYKSYELQTAATSALAEWSDATAATEAYTNAPQALKISVSGTAASLWAVDVNSPDYELFKDATALAAPTMASPEDGYGVPVNAGTGQAYNVTFTWARYSDSDITDTELEIATDADFEGVVYTGAFDISGQTSDTIAKAIGPTGVETPTNQKVDLMPGSTYYWRVRSTEPVYSMWSESRSFRVMSPVSFAITGPAIGDADVATTPTLTWAAFEGALGYELNIAEDPTFSILDVTATADNNFYSVMEPLATSTTYYWRVRAITGEAVISSKGKYSASPTGPWVTGIFTTAGVPEEAEGPAIITITEPAPPAPAPEVKIVEVPTAAPIPATLLWAIVIIGAVLVIALITLIVRTRRVA